MKVGWDLEELFEMFKVYHGVNDVRWIRIIYLSSKLFSRRFPEYISSLEYHFVYFSSLRKIWAKIFYKFIVWYCCVYCLLCFVWSQLSSSRRAFTISLSFHFRVSLLSHFHSDIVHHRLNFTLVPTSTQLIAIYIYDVYPWEIAD